MTAELQIFQQILNLIEICGIIILVIIYLANHIGDSLEIRNLRIENRKLKSQNEYIKAQNEALEELYTNELYVKQLKKEKSKKSEKEEKKKPLSNNFKVVDQTTERKA